MVVSVIHISCDVTFFIFEQQHFCSAVSWRREELFFQLMLLTPTKSPTSLWLMWMDVALPALHEH